MEQATMSDPQADAKQRLVFESQRVYIVANIAGAAMLFIFLQTIWLHGGATSLKKGVLWGIIAFAVGVGVAMLGYVARHWALRKNQLNAGLFHQIAHTVIPIIAIVCFVIGLLAPVIGGFDSLNSPNERPGLLKEFPKKR
jgi:predicted cobalt transporter CbtA